jgi:hypothetical protein
MSVCPLCGKGFSSTCFLCRERTYRLTPLMLIDDPTQFPWPKHRPVWNDPTQAGMHCELCGLPIPSTMTMKELFGPCSGGSVKTLGEMP